MVALTLFALVVVDARSLAPIDGAHVRRGDSLFVTGAEGRAPVPAGARVSVTHVAYKPFTGVAPETLRLSPAVYTLPVVSVRSTQGRALLADGGTAERLVGANGVTLREMAGMKSLALRNATAEETAILLAGVPVAPLTTGAVDLNLLPLGLLGGVELFEHGVNAPGTGLLGGAANFTVSHVPRAEGSMGSYGNSSASVSTGGKAAFGADFATWGNYPYRDEFGAPAEYKNADGRRVSALFSADAGALSAVAVASALETGVPGPTGAPSPQARRADDLALAGVSYEGPVTASLSAVTLHERYEDAAASGVADNYAADGSVGFGKGGLALFVGGREERVSGDALGRRRRGSLSLTGEAPWRDVRSSVTLEAAGGRLLPLFGLSWSAAALSAALSGGTRLPTFNELYWPEDAFARGNPDLAPETGLSATLGVRVAGTRVSAYARAVRGFISWRQGPDGKWSPTNASSALFRGVELSRRLALAGVTATVEYAYALSTDDGVELPLRPRHTGRLDASWRFARASLALVGSRPYLPNSPKRLAAALLADVGLVLPLGGGARAELRVTNALDERYEYYRGYPMPPRGFEVRVRRGI